MNRDRAAASSRKSPKRAATTRTEAPSNRTRRTSERESARSESNLALRKKRSDADSESLKWLRSLQEYLADFLPLFIDDEDIIPLLLTPEAMNVWARAFTHQSFNLEFNYESLETIGDALLDAAFALILIERFGTKMDVSNQIMTETKNHYMSKAYQAKKALLYGFDQYLRMGSSVDPNISTREDLYESFAGALYFAGEMIDSDKTGSQSGLGFTLVRLFLSWDLSQKGTELKPYTMNSVTFIQQTLKIFTQGGGDVLSEEWVANEGSISGVFVLTIAPDFVTFLSKNYGIQLPDVLAEEYGDTQKVARKNAYEKARTVLEKAGLDYENVEKLKQRFLWNRQDKSLRDAAIKKAEKLGYSDLKIDFIRSATRGMTVHAAIIGIYYDGDPPTKHSEILASANAPENEAATLALEAFISDDWPGPSTGVWEWIAPATPPTHGLWEARDRGEL